MTALPFPLRAVIACGCLFAAPAACDSGRSAHSDRAPISLTSSDVHIIGTSEAIAGVEDLDVPTDGSIWLQNSIDPFFVGFTPDGDVLRVHGRRGGGPEEFGAPSGFVVGGIDGAVWTFDRARHVLVRISAPDSTRREIALPRDGIPAGSLAGGVTLLTDVARMAGMGDEVVFARRLPLRESDVLGFWRSFMGADLVAFDPATGSVRDVVALSRVLGERATDVQLPDGFPPIPLWSRLWTVCSDSEIRIYDRFRNELRGFTADGVELDAIVLPSVRYTAVTPRQFARATVSLAIIEAMGQVVSTDVTVTDSARVINDLLPRLNATPAQLADLLPRYVDLRCDDAGSLWIRPFDLDSGGLKGGRSWLRITSAGETREVRFPDRFDAYRFKSARIWGVQRDAFDVASVAWMAAPGRR